MFRNKTETSSGKGPIAGVSKHWNNGLYREIIETDWNMTKIDYVQTFQLFRNVSKQNWNKFWKRWKYQALFLVFRNTETMDYIGKKLKRTETWRKLTKSNVSVVLKRFETKLKQALKKVKIPGPISGVSKHWNSGLYWEKNWNRLKHEENWLSPHVSVVSKQNWNKLWQRWNRLSASQFSSCFSPFGLKQWII